VAAQSRISGPPKLLSVMAKGDFCFALNHALTLMSYAFRFQTQPGTGRLLPKAATAGEWIATGSHSPASPAYSDWQDTIETRKGKEA
jgi:hypothetical protein